jgi:hypothetical protein
MMSNIDNWPKAEILTSLPATARLEPRFDTDLLRADLAKTRGANWAQPRIVDSEGVGRYATVMDWRTISLRSIGGDPGRTDPGGPELADFADTPLRHHLPYISMVLSSIPAPLRCARLMALGPGAESPRHLDTKCGLPWGNVRLHVPLVTTPGAVLEISGETHCWQPGELWYADFTRMHIVRNTDATTRVHLVIDTVPTKELVQLFPDEFASPAVLAETLMACDAAPLTAAELSEVRRSFDLPASFRSFEEADGEFTKDNTLRPAAVDRYGDGLALFVAGEPAVALVHVGAREFRFAGWTTERTIQVAPRNEVILRSRVGATTFESRHPARAL